MSARERILALRLMEKQKTTPELMERLGVKITVRAKPAREEKEK